MRVQRFLCYPPRSSHNQTRIHYSVFSHAVSQNVTLTKTSEIVQTAIKHKLENELEFTKMIKLSQK